MNPQLLLETSTNGRLQYVLPFARIGMSDLPRVGGKNASLGEMTSRLSQLGIRIPKGFALSTEAFWDFITANNLKQFILEKLASLDRKDYSNLHEIGEAIRAQIMLGTLPKEIQRAIIDGYMTLSESGTMATVAVRSSATAEDLPNASFAGQQETYLNVSGEENVVRAVHKCYASLYTDRAIKYREDNSFDHMKVGLSVGVQCMVRADKGASGVAFTIDPDTGFDNAMLITGSWGLGENVVGGVVIPDEFLLFKPSLLSGRRPVISKKLGSKEKMMIFGESKLANGLAFSPSDHDAGVWNIDTPESLRNAFVLNDLQLEHLGEWLLAIEDHYDRPMDVEWALDGITGELWILQARPETVRSREKHLTITEYELAEEGILLAHGLGLGNKIVSGRARVLASPKQGNLLQAGDILVTDITSPDWDPILKRAGAIVTNNGGRTSHAAIVARELGTPAIIGTINGTSTIKDGETVTIVCNTSSRGEIYRGELRFTKLEREIGSIVMPKTHPMLILGDPEQAFRLSFYPNMGVGLLRLEFIINNLVKIHPMALVNFPNIKDEQAKKQIEHLTAGYSDKSQYFVEMLAQGVATIAAAFYPKDVVVRMSDFKTNEYANLIGGAEFEPKEENPMIGFRGASRYYNSRYQPGFELECQAMHWVRNEIGLTNVKLMIPFCRTIAEGERVIKIMEQQGLHRGEDGLEVYVMAEIPSNVLLAKGFAEIFDGFSIGSNDLTQLTLGIDRDSAIIHDLFDEQNEAPKAMIAAMIEAARVADRKIGLCGQAPSDYPAFAEFLVSHHIDSISFNPDALLRGIENINAAEAKYPTHFEKASEAAMLAHASHLFDFDAEE
ncbi:MAG: phosphoenolpyruvate synthase [Bacteroidota bacterium]|nr:phosphoenolpyruvate synthase [Bacteroidota bacterium]MDP4232480.1 phosphoenolpyruvate synthase [Bacteroidota bacterium]MDP4241615.1 phosphoenolpyruvate synthase [Bacteroidota bacterium]MDP4286360.1 phosphoenolpyruvate synthase [Bacteroidota bacterium]